MDIIIIQIDNYIPCLSNNQGDIGYHYPMTCKIIKIILKE